MRTGTGAVAVTVYAPVKLPWKFVPPRFTLYVADVFPAPSKLIGPTAATPPKPSTVP